MRKAWLDWFRNFNFEAVVCYGGGSFTTRIMIKLLFAAARVLLRIEPAFVCVETEADALAWINRRRAIE